jgi:hypothetical protein
MLRKRLASLALAAGLGLTSGCLGFGNPWCPRPACCPSSPCCAAPVNGDGVGGILSGYGGGLVEAAPCCNSHGGPPAAVEGLGPILAPPQVAPPVNGGPPPVNGGLPPVNGGAPTVLDPGALAPAPNPRLVPSPQAPPTPYTPSSGRARAL